MGVGSKPRRPRALSSLEDSRQTSQFSLTRVRRGFLYSFVIIGAAWLLFFRTRAGSNDSFSKTIREKAYLLTSSISDEDLYGPPIPPRRVKARIPLQSAIQPLRLWGREVPETRIIGIAGGWSLLDNVILMNETMFIVTNHPESFPEPQFMFSKSIEAAHGPSWPQSMPTSKEIQLINTTSAYSLFGSSASRIEGVTFFCNDGPQYASNYYQLWAEVFFGFWRTYSMLDLNISRDGVTTLAPPRRIIFPRITRETFDDKGGLGAYISRAAFPSMGLEFADTWADRNETNRPFLLERVVIGDRVAAEHASEWPGLYKYAAPAFTLPGSPQDAWWAPIRRGLIQFLDQYDSPRSESAKGKVVVTYISRQRSTRRKLHSGDHLALIKALETLHRGYNYEVNVVNMEELSKKDQLSLAARTTVMIGLHGNGLTHALWMDPNVRPVLMEFFCDQGYSSDYEFPMRQLGIAYYGWWNDKYFGHQNLPQVNFPREFHANNIRIDAQAVVELILQHTQESYPS
ncbi:hypothetical protein BS47DRAFT_1392986 [Hydnum rufescens UP504]|uniref:Glycosyltransferase 61 catalytic domain-containing protein n=1 Tax=Hydnum rufescens UP504 TaxID=1448309 RepID=A0A9P6DXD4_9AGAM|nr:hypothetical protein BS47DRAFT_1392986 [Hydnum rufescens UP504]